MEIRFSEAQLSSVLKLALAMIEADGKVKEVELAMLADELGRIGVPREAVESLIDSARAKSAAEAISAISGFDATRKRYIGALLGSLLVVDGDANKDELKLWSFASVICDLPTMSIAEAVAFIKGL